MENLCIWQSLGIEKTNDKRAIKDAYTRRLEEHGYDEDPEALINLEQAYKQALLLSDANESNFSNIPGAERRAFQDFLNQRNDIPHIFARKVLEREFDLINMIRLVKHRPYTEAAESIFDWLEKNSAGRDTSLLPQENITWWYEVHRKGDLGYDY